MPIYEFYCPKTHTIYSFYARSLAAAGKVPRCPDDPKAPMERVASTFAITKGVPEPTAPESSGDPEMDARMERAMMEMEREFSHLDESNPDPKKMAELMKKMASLSGQKMPEVFDEMIGRMAAGEDPEALEAEYGDALDGLGDEIGDGPNDPPGSGLQRFLHRRRQPNRDKTLYEITDYLD